MGNEVIIAIVGLFCSIISSIVTFLLTRKKYGAEVESQQIQNMTESFEVYKKTMHDSLNLQNKKIADLERENGYLRQQVAQMQEQLTALLLSKATTSVRKTSKKQ